MSARIEMVDLAARHAASAAEVEARVLAVLRSGRYVGGPVVAEAEAAVARAFGREAAAGVASGTDALILGLQVLGIGPGDEVIVPALSFFATAGAVAAIGAVPRVVDVREDGRLDPDAAARAVGPRTRALIPVHLYGSAAPCPDLGVPVLDDAAQAAGADPPLSRGRLTATSVYPTKVWGAAGDGGFLVGDADDVAAARRLGSHGHDGHGRFEAVRGAIGRNSRLDAVQAAVLLGHADRAPERIARRRANAARYDAQLPRWVRPMPRDPGCPVPVYAVRTDRARAIAALDAAGIGWAAYYDRALHRQPALSHPAETPVADALAAELLALPVHAGLSDADVDRVCAALERA